MGGDEYERTLMANPVNFRSAIKVSSTESPITPNTLSRNKVANKHSL